MVMFTNKWLKTSPVFSKLSVLPPAHLFSSGKFRMTKPNLSAIPLSQLHEGNNLFKVALNKTILALGSGTVEDPFENFKVQF